LSPFLSSRKEKEKEKPPFLTSRKEKEKEAPPFSHQEKKRRKDPSNSNTVPPI